MYIDANIFIFAAVDTGKTGDQCRDIVTRLEDRDISAASSYLVIDEVLWVLQHEIGRADAVRATRMILSLPVRWMDIKRDVTVTALRLYEATDLDPRDAFHVAVMNTAGLTTILSQDSDFDGIQGIQRIPPAHLLEDLE